MHPHCPQGGYESIYTRSGNAYTLMNLIGSSLVCIDCASSVALEQCRLSQHAWVCVCCVCSTLLCVPSLQNTLAVAYVQGLLCVVCLLSEYDLCCCCDQVNSVYCMYSAHLVEIIQLVRPGHFQGQCAL